LETVTTIVVKLPELIGDVPWIILLNFGWWWWRRRLRRQRQFLSLWH